MENKESLKGLADRVKKTQEYINNIKGSDMSDFTNVIDSLPDIPKAFEDATAHLSKGDKKKLKPLMDQLKGMLTNNKF